MSWLMPRWVTGIPAYAGTAIALETPGGQLVYGTSYDRPLRPELTFSVRTVHLRVSPEPPGAARNVWPVRVERMVFQGDFTQVHVAWGEQRLVTRSATMEPLVEGQQAYLTVAPRHVVLLDE